MRITHVIYDLDGTLLDTEPFYIATTNAIFERHGMVLTPDVRAIMMGRPNAIGVPLMLEHTGLPMTAEEFIHERDTALSALAAGMQVVAVPEPGFADRVSGAHAIIESLEAFDPASWGLPPFAMPGLNER